VIDHALKVANSKVSTLIIGESGTGKELIARLIHQSGPRKQNPFVSVSCGALTETLLERELFGNEKGAFTGADTLKIGLFEAADGGTIFLDEIGEMPVTMQVKLLRVLQEKSFLRVGGTRQISVDVRVIAATHRDIKKMIAEENFREDLYYRLNVVQINIPPLRERKEDIDKLIHYFIKRHQMDLNVPENFSVPEEIIESIKNYQWPGNIRQLENAIERALVMGNRKELKKEDLPKDILDDETETIEAGKSLKDAQDVFKKSYVLKTLSRARGNRTRAAEILKIQRTYLSRLIKELGID
ncbi:MAG: sigma-54 dependent transcriptional regulator, partial [Nitrospinota bacterium]|nr:sigma-54 dependent transcriptional regulator [Nitrospinota bacterium]